MTKKRSSGRSKTKRLPVGPSGAMLPGDVGRNHSAVAATHASASSSSAETSQRAMSVCSTVARSARVSPKCALIAPVIPSRGEGVRP